MEFLQHFLPGQAIEKNGHDSVGLQTLWTSNSTALRAGLELELTRGYLEETQPGATTGSAFLVATIPAGKHYDYEVDASLAGVFINYNVDITQRLSLNSGLRYQYTSYDYNNKMNTGRVREDGTACGFGGCRFNRPGDRRDSFSKLSPRLGMIYNLSDQHQIYGSLSQGFRAPQATELYRLQDSQDVSRIDPVELDAIEIGVRGDGNSISYNVSVYGMQKNNFIFRDTSRSNVDNGETRHRGIELDLRYRFSDQLSAALAFTYARHEYDNNPALSSSLLDGNTIDTAPETLGSMTLDWHPAENLSMELEWVHVGDYYEDPENRNSYEGHDLLHLRTKWQATKAATVFARGMNLSDEDYAERADFAFGSDRYFVGTPRSVYLGVTLRL
jgi:outer membrane receptor protein involved in Fe transport